MKAPRRLAGMAIAAVAAVALPITVAQPANAACPSGTYPPSSCAPTLTMTGPAPVTLGAARVSWSVRTFGASLSYYQLRYTRAAWNGNLQGWTYPSSWQHLTTAVRVQTLPIGYTYCYSARAIDSANRVGPWAKARCATRALDDRSFAVSSSWRRGAGSVYYLGTVSTTTRLGARAVRTGAKFRRIAVVATACPSCGKVGVYAGTSLIGTLNFASSATAWRQVRYTPSFSGFTGTITLRNLSSGKRVWLDGVAVIH